MKNILHYILVKMDLYHNILVLTDEWWELIGDMNLLVNTTQTSKYVDDNGNYNPSMDWFDIDIINPLDKCPIIHDGGSRRFMLDNRINFLKHHTYKDYREIIYSQDYWK